LGTGFLLPTLQPPAAIPVHLRRLCLRPGLFAGGEPRPARLDHRRIDDLAAHGEVAAVVEDTVKAIEQPLDRASPG
jgi:hypothetical protein